MGLGVRIVVACAAAGLAFPMPALGSEIRYDVEMIASWAGGPFPIPLASDPSNALGDSVDGYGFVDSEVLIAVSAERPVDPATASTGTLTATPAGGQSYAVESTIEVFFDLTLTDVDPRPGRNYAGQADGTVISFEDVGPSSWTSSWLATFDPNEAAFGLFPPGPTNPYIGDVGLEIPLGGDVNGNGANDKIKFTLGTLVVTGVTAVLESPFGPLTFLTDTARKLEGVVVDETSDPPFLFGADVPDPVVFGGATSFALQLRTPVPEPATAALLALALGVLAVKGRATA